MRPSILKTLSVPLIGSPAPASVAIAAKTPMRLLIRNVGSTIAFLAHEASSLQDISATSSAYQLPPGQEDVFVLAPGQGVWAVGAGAGGTLCYALSEAIPTTSMES